MVPWEAFHCPTENPSKAANIKSFANPVNFFIFDFFLFAAAWIFFFFFNTKDKVQDYCLGNYFIVWDVSFSESLTS